MKELAGKYLDEEITNRRKSGFGFPLGRWIRSKQGVGEQVDMLSNNSKFDGYFDKKQLKKVVTEHRLGNNDHSEFLWVAINFNTWRSIFGI